MEIRLLELLLTQPFIFLILGVLVCILTYVLKAPIKAHTAKIKDEQKRKLANKWILTIPFILALVLYFLYRGIAEKKWLTEYELLTSSAFSIAALAITIYNVFEGIKGRKSEYETDDDGIALYNLLLVYSKDRNKVKLLLDQCKENYAKGSFEINDTVKGWLPDNIDADTVNTIVKAIKKYLDLKQDQKLEEEVPL